MRAAKRNRKQCKAVNDAMKIILLFQEKMWNALKQPTITILILCELCWLTS